MTRAHRYAICAAALFSCAAISTVSAQGKPDRGDLALTYQWVHSNTQPGDCGCFGLNGAAISGSYHLSNRWSLAVEVAGGYQGHGPATANTLTLLSFVVGPRYNLPRWGQGVHALMPYVQVLAGGAHAGGGIAGAGDGDFAFAARAGGGIDLPLLQHLSLRLVQADYYPTTFTNTKNDHQNNVSLETGAVFHW